MAVRRKYYTVWVGAAPGVYDSWSECQLQIKGYPGARFKSFDTKEAAVEAYRGRPEDSLGVLRSIARHMNVPAHPDINTVDGVRDYTTVPGVRLDAIAVDGACAGNPGVMEYRAVRVADGKEVFRRGSAGNLIGTNNIGEYLAIIHIAASLAAKGDTTTPIYSDSRTALSWVRRGASKSTLERNPRTEMTLQLLARADKWLHEHKILNPILKWDTDKWGEIPADFGRKL